MIGKIVAVRDFAQPNKPDHWKIEQAQLFDVHYRDRETNVAVSTTKLVCTRKIRWYDYIFGLDA